MKGFFKVYRDTLQYDILNDPDALSVWIFLSGQVRFKPCIHNGIEIQAGQILTSGGILASKCGIDRNRVQYILRCFEKEGLIRRENIRNRYSLITVIPHEETEVPVN